MAKYEAKTHLRLHVVVVFMCMLFSSLCTAEDNDTQLLLSIKGLINDPLNYLSTWNSSLSLSFCHWNGVSCDHSSSHVTKINLSGKNISGRISESIFHFRYLETIDLSSNQLSGEIPSDISCFSLKYLNLSNNNLTGPLPKSSMNQKMETLDLSNNMLSGEIPEETGFLLDLKVLDFGGNLLVGSIPKSITNLTRLEFLTLASNQLVGEIPPGLALMKNLKWIYLGHNNFSGGIPNEICELTSLNHLDLVYNNLTGEIPSCLGNLIDLKYLFLYLNQLTGPIPQSIFTLKNLISLDLSDNFLSGEISEHIIQLQNLEVLHLFSNNFTGTIPSALSSLPKLQVLQLWSNGLSGEIPKQLGKQNNLTILDLSTNNLTGKIPKTLCESGHLFKLILFSNSLEGHIPENLSRCRSLQRVRLQSNCLSGELSPEFTKLPLVYFLDISANNISGTISGREWKMPELLMLNLARNNLFGELPDSFGSIKVEDLELSENGFSGSIPSSYGNFSELMKLNLSKNKLSGNIPDELSSCKKVVSLDLSHNQLSGEIPTIISQMPVLGQLDLSMNQLSGKIPSDLGKVESLVQVNISHNHFHGSLPSTGAFLAINSSAVAGNNLCGGESETPSGLPPCKGVKNPFLWVFLVCLFVVFAAIGVAAFAFVSFRRRNQREIKKVESEDGNWELQFFDSKTENSITMDDILSCRREENIISRGNLGISYKGSCDAIVGMQFIVREMNGVSIPMSFWTDAAELGKKTRHPNITKLTAICRSEKSAFLVYEYTDGKPLSEAFQGLSWERRRRIAEGIARALRYLHCNCSPCILVGDLSPEKVVVNGKDEACLQLTLPYFFCRDHKSFMSSTYVAPETRDTKDIKERSDIYGFGLILIELLTGKSPSDTEFMSTEHGRIVEWARYCYSDCHLESWVDPFIKGYALNNQNEMVEAMNLALHCTAGDPTARPCANDVAKTLGRVGKSSSYCVLDYFKFSSSNI